MTTATIPMSEFSHFMQGLNAKLSTGMDGRIDGLREASPDPEQNRGQSPGQSRNNFRVMS